MTPEEQAEQQAFIAALRQALADQAQLVLGTEAAIYKRLKDAAAHITALLASQPAEWQQWHLGELQTQVRALLQGMEAAMAATADAGVQAAWAGGVAAVERPLLAAGIYRTLQLPVLSTNMLQGLRSFTAGRIKDASAEALAVIDRQIGLVVLGAQTPWQAMQAVQGALGAKDATTWRRAQTIVRTGTAQAYAIAHQLRAEQTAELVPEVRKVWRRSGKIHSRAAHDAADGQVVKVKQKFTLHTPRGKVRLLHPHDPAAPAAEIINCGCRSTLWMADWDVPAAKPFTERELALNPAKRDLAEQMEKLQARQKKRP